MPGPVNSLRRWLGITKEPAAVATGEQMVTLTFTCDRIEDTGTDYAYYLGNDWIVVAPKTVTPTEPPSLITRAVDGKRLFKRVINGQNVVLRERDTQSLTEQVDITFHERGEPAFASMPIRGNFSFIFDTLPSLIVETEPEPPPPPPPPVVNEWRVAYSLGMNIRSTPEVTSTNLLGGVPGGWVFDNAGVMATGSDFSWLQIHRGEYGGKDFAGAWIAAKKISSGFVYCVPNIEEEPAPLTVQLAGPLRLETRADGWTYLKGGEGNGFNMRYMATGRYNPDEYLDFIAGNGFKWVRVYFSQENHTLQQCIDKFGVILNKAQARGLLVCGVITDSLGHSGMIIEEDRPWHTGGGIGHLNIDWFMSKQYQVDYYRYIDGFARAFKSHAGLGMIDLCNEPGIYGVSPIEVIHTNAYTQCFAEGARLAYAASDGVKPIGLGDINAQHSKPTNKPNLDHARDLLKAMPYVQVWDVHIYSEKDYHPDELYRFEADCVNFDYVAAKETGKAIFGGEIGSWYTNNDRPRATRNVLERNKVQWSGGWYWGLALHADNGEADAHAMARYRDGQAEFDGMLAALKEYNVPRTVAA